MWYIIFINLLYLHYDSESNFISLMTYTKHIQLIDSVRVSQLQNWKGVIHNKKLFNFLC